MKARGITVMCTVGLLLTACGSAPDASQPSVDDPVFQYGLGPVRDPNTIYQDDVVLIDDGPQAIKAVSDDGLVWTMDGNAKGVDEVRPGKIMFATNNAVGRVVEVEPAGDDVAVTLAPADITSVVKEGELDIDRPLNLDDFVFQEIPGLTRLVDAGDSQPSGEPAESEAQGEPAVVEPGGLRIVGASQLGQPARPKATPMPLPKSGDAYKVSAGDLEAEISRDTESITLKMAYAAAGKGGGGKLKGGATIKLLVDNPRFNGKMSVRDGQVDSSSASIRGLKAIDVKVDVGTSGTSVDNEKQRVELPIKLLSAPFATPVGPMVAKWEFKFIITPGFTQKGTTVQTSATYPLRGHLGFENGKLQKPTLDKSRSLVENLFGPTIGVTGLTVAVETKVSVGYGVPLASAGPYAKLQFAAGVTVGSSAGIAGQCKETTVVVTGGIGFGLDISEKLADGLTKVLGDRFKKVFDAENKISSNYKEVKIHNWSDAEPNSKMCKT